MFKEALSSKIGQNKRKRRGQDRPTEYERGGASPDWYDPPPSKAQQEIQKWEDDTHLKADADTQQKRDILGMSKNYKPGPGVFAPHGARSIAGAAATGVGAALSTAAKGVGMLLDDGRPRQEGNGPKRRGTRRGAKRRGTKRRGTKRRGTKRRGTKRR